LLVVILTLVVVILTLIVIILSLQPKRGQHQGQASYQEEISHLYSPHRTHNEQQLCAFLWPSRVTLRKLQGKLIAVFTADTSGSEFPKN
jgi:hypothetical protein